MTTNAHALAGALINFRSEDLESLDPVALFSIRELAGDLAASCDREMLKRAASEVKVEEVDA